MLAFEGTDLPEAIILRSLSEADDIDDVLASEISLAGAAVWWLVSLAFSMFAIDAPIVQVLPAAVRGETREVASGERKPPRTQKPRG